MILIGFDQVKLELIIIGSIEMILIMMLNDKNAMISKFAGNNFQVLLMFSMVLTENVTTSRTRTRFRELGSCSTLRTTCASLRSTFAPLYVLRVVLYVTLTPSLAPTKVGARSVFATWVGELRVVLNVCPTLRTTSLFVSLH